jgi:hypothetical protein
MGAISLKYKSKSGNLTAPGDVDPGAMIPLATTIVGSGGTSSVTFSNIPQVYEHLQIRMIAQVSLGSDPGGGGGLGLRFNGDSGTNYTRHLFGSYGTGLEGYGEANTNTALIERFPYRLTNNSIYGGAVCDILDYKNGNKNKTIRNLGGWDNNSSGEIYFNSSVWRSTSAITSIEVYSSSYLLKEYSHIALYGIKGAGA